MFIDCHIHIGQYYNNYFAPYTVYQLMEQLGVEYYIASSTTQCEENYSKVLDEFRQLIDIAGEKVLPVMWITPEGLKGNIAWYLESDIKWRCLKIHPFLHKHIWNPQGELLKEVIDIARELKVPLLIHTGNEDECQSRIFEDAIAENADVTFILAHGRPYKDASAITKTYDNAYVDSAFMSVDEMKLFIDDRLSHKLLWGTDMCIPRHFYPNIDMQQYYIGKINAFRNVCTPKQFEQVTCDNALKVFGL